MALPTIEIFDTMTGTKRPLDPVCPGRVGIYVCGVTRDLIIKGNTIRETRSGDQRHQRYALYVAPQVTGLTVSANIIEGHPDADVVDDAREATNALQVMDDADVSSSAG